ncbi:hypothetical protein D3C71_1141900 [compost metagenome]
MLQLADVAGPGVAAQCVLCAGRQPQAAQAQAGTVQFQKAACQQQHIVAPFAQRRDGHGVHRQPVVQVGAERAIAHLLAQVAVGGGDHAHVHAARAVGAQALDLAVLQRAQQLSLHGQWQLAHLVEEQRAALGRLEAPWPVGHRARERAAHMAKQLALGQRLRQRRAVHVHQRAGSARGLAVQQAREQLLAHTGLTQQQHGQVRARHHL